MAMNFPKIRKISAPVERRYKEKNTLTPWRSISHAIRSTGPDAKRLRSQSMLFKRISRTTKARARRLKVVARGGSDYTEKDDQTRQQLAIRTDYS